MTSLTVTIVVAIVAFAFVLAPIFRRGGRRDALGDLREVPREGAESAVRVSSLNAQLEELELDRATGKLELTDFERLRAELIAGHPSQPDAVSVSARVPVGSEKESDTARPPSPNDASAPTDDELDRFIAAALVATVRCESCGERPEPGAAFCSSCGRRLAGCPACGAEQSNPDAKFCAACGAALNA